MQSSWKKNANARLVGILGESVVQNAAQLTAQKLLAIAAAAVSIGRNGTTAALGYRQCYDQLAHIMQELHGGERILVLAQEWSDVLDDGNDVRVERVSIDGRWLGDFRRQRCWC